MIQWMESGQHLKNIEPIYNSIKIFAHQVCVFPLCLKNKSVIQ